MPTAEQVATDFLIDAVAALSAAARRPNADCTTLYDLADESIAKAVAVLAAQRPPVLEPKPPLEDGDFGSTTEVDHIEEYRADPTFRMRTFRKRT